MHCLSHSQLYILTLLATSACISSNTDDDCPQSTFHNTYISTTKQYENGFYYTGCLNGENLTNPEEIWKISLSYSSLTELKKKAITNFPNAAQLYITRNTNLRSIEEDAFVNLPKLVKIVIQRNELVKINQIFHGLKVQYLLLDHNAIEEIESDTFALPKLTYLRLDNNNLKIVKFRWFGDSSSSLQHLHLFNNNITDVEDCTFSKMPDLVELRLSDNFLTEVKKSWFQCNDTIETFDQLKKLNISANQLLSIPEGFLGMFKNLETLELQRNNLFTLGSWFSEAFAISGMNLNDNKIKIIPAGTFSKFSNLEYIYLARNLIGEVSPNWFVGKEFECANNSKNTIEKFAIFADKSGNNATKLKNITSANTWTTNLPKLVYINLSANKISLVHDRAFAQLKNLDGVNLENNYLTQVKGSWFPSQKFRALALSGNKIKEMPMGELADLTKLSHLWMKSNGIIEIKNNWFSHDFDNCGIKLFWLDLENNPIGYIEEKVLKCLEQSNIFLIKYTNGRGN